MIFRNTQCSSIEKLTDVIRDTLKSDNIDSKTSNIAGDCAMASVVVQTIYQVGRQLIAPSPDPDVSLLIVEGTRFPDDLE